MIPTSDLAPTRKAVAIGALIFVVATSVVEGCTTCDQEDSLKPEETEYPGIPPKRDIFMSRGWGAGGGPAFPGRPNSGNVGLGKRPRIIEVLTNEDDVEAVPEPRTEYLRSKAPTHPTSSNPSRRRVYFPQLFISSGWGPLGK